MTQLTDPYYSILLKWYGANGELLTMYYDGATRGFAEQCLRINDVFINEVPTVDPDWHDNIKQLSEFAFNTPFHRVNRQPNGFVPENPPHSLLTIVTGYRRPDEVQALQAVD